MVTYVLENIEVKKTGRVAVKPTPASAAIKQPKLVEVTPANEDDGSWKKWVHENALFEIKTED